MRPNSFILALCAQVIVSVATAQFPTPGPEHKFLEKQVGTWDCVVKAGGETSKGVSVNKMDLSGLWLASSFSGEIAGTKFEGRGMDSYDAAKKKYIGVWFDSMSTQPLHMEGTVDKDGKVMTLEGEGPSPTGQPMKMTSTTKLVDDNTIEFALTTPGPDGKPMVMIEITYKRRK